MFAKLFLTLLAIFPSIKICNAAECLEDKVLIVSEQGFSHLATYMQGSESVAVLFHGSGGFDQYTDALKTELCKADKTDLIVLVDWSQHSGNQILAPFQGQKIGKKLARSLPKEDKTYYVIGISVGAFAADEFVRGLKSHGQQNSVSLVLLDPFVAKGFDFNYGLRFFGKEADQCIHYLNTDDPVPFTNKPLRHCDVRDVTKERPDATPGHDWPLIYFTSLVKQELAPYL